MGAGRAGATGWAGPLMAPGTARRLLALLAVPLGRASAQAAEVVPRSSEVASPRPYACQEDLATWDAAWSPKKKAWCCEHWGLGCESGEDDLPATSSVAFRCQEDYSDRQRSWSGGKKEWCCAHEAIGCGGSPSPPEILPAATASPATAEAQAAAELSAVSVRTSAPPDPFDCEESPGEPSTGWGAARRAWCCTAKGMGCTDAGAPASAALATAPLDSAPSPTRLPAGVASCGGERFYALTYDQQDFCCTFYGVCPTTTTTTTPVVHCDNLAGASKEKRDFCCIFYQVGCASTAASPLTIASPAPEAPAAPAGAASSQGSCPTVMSSWSSDDSRGAAGKARTAECCGHWRRTGSWPTYARAFCCLAADRECAAWLMSTRCGDGPMSAARKEWCCVREHVGCGELAQGGALAEGRSAAGTQEVAPRGAETAPGHECATGRKGAWSSEEKEWCCEHRRPPWQPSRASAHPACAVSDSGFDSEFRSRAPRAWGRLSHRAARQHLRHAHLAPAQEDRLHGRRAHGAARRGARRREPWIG